MGHRHGGDDAQLIAAALQAFEEAGPDFEPVLDLVCRLGCELTGDPWIIRLVGDDGTLHLAGSSAADAETLSDIRNTIGSIRTPYFQSLVAAVWGDGEPVLLTDEVLSTARDSAQPEIAALTERRGIRGGILAPLRVRGRVTGALWWACQHHGGDHDETDIRFASSVADRCALAIDNARLLRSIEAERNRHAALLAHISDAVCIVDAEGVITHVAPGGVTRVLGWEVDDVLGTNVFDLVHRRDQAGAFDGFVNVLGPDDRPPQILRLRHRNGGWRHLEVNANNLLDDPAVGGVVITAHDVTERILADALLSAENEILELVATAAPLTDSLNAVCRMVDARITTAISSVWLIDDAADELLAVAAPGLGGLEGLSQGRAGANMARNLPDSIMVSDPETEPVWERYREEARANGIGCSWTRTIRDADGRELGLLILYRRELREPSATECQVIELAVRLAGVAVHRARDAERLAHAATHDPVTGLANRRLFLERLQHAVARQRRGARPPAVLFVDLDRFKQVNDRAGHAAGDDVLRFLGERLERVVRPTDVVARFGGDEFAVLCDETGEEEAMSVAERLLAAVCEPVELNGRRHHVSASIGIAAGRPGVTHDALVRRADVAMYRAKTRGSGGIIAFRSGMADRGRADLEHDLRKALDNGEITVHYQPIADVQRARWVGVEALARWWHPSHGWIPPTTFIDIAEEVGLINPLGEHVLSVASLQGAAWITGGLPDLHLNVNVSGRQLTESRFVAMVERQLAQSGIDPSRLFLELTETTMMEDYDTARAAISQLDALGVGLVIDDFGTGHSTLARLRDFPASSLKLDRTFILELGLDTASSELVAAVVQLAHAVNLVVVAEGVETVEQLHALHALGVDAAQGYLLAAPAPADEVTSILHGAPDAVLRAGLLPVATSSGTAAGRYASGRSGRVRR